MLCRANANQADRWPYRRRDARGAGTKISSRELRDYRGNPEAALCDFGEKRHPEDVAVADDFLAVRHIRTSMISLQSSSHRTCIDVMPRAALMEDMNQQALFEKSRIFFHLATLDHGAAPLFEGLAVRYWMKAVALEDQSELRNLRRCKGPSERTAA
jgi:hypothetical protein